MMILIRLAWRNVIGAGLRSWLNALILAITLLAIVWQKGMLDGWYRQAQRDTRAWSVAGGQYWHPDYDPFDPVAIAESYGELPSELAAGEDIAPELIIRGVVYPHGRMRLLLFKGIPHSQHLLSIPVPVATASSEVIPVSMGRRLAQELLLKTGDRMMARWQTANGVVDAREFRIDTIFNSSVPGIDLGQIWLDIDILRAIMGLTGAEATLACISSARAEQLPQTIREWRFQSPRSLMSDLVATVQAKSIGGMFFYLMLMGLSMVTLFDTQVLAVFRRQKEIGMQIALGMTRMQIILLFTIEGVMIAALSVVIASVIGGPLLVWQARIGIPVPQGTDQFGIAIAERLYPVYDPILLLSTLGLIFAATTLVSYWPARRIAAASAVQALRGKLI